MIGDPAVEIGQRAGAERLLLGNGLFIAAQPRAVGAFGSADSGAAGTAEIGCSSKHAGVGAI
jgi:hypothetical protein